MCACLTCSGHPHLAVSANYGQNSSRSAFRLLFPPLRWSLGDRSGAFLSLPESKPLPAVASASPCSCVPPSARSAARQPTRQEIRPCGAFLELNEPLKVPSQPKLFHAASGSGTASPSHAGSCTGRQRCPPHLSCQPGCPHTGHHFPITHFGTVRTLWSEFKSTEAAAVPPHSSDAAAAVGSMNSSGLAEKPARAGPNGQVMKINISI